MTDIRKETDSLGEVDVAADKLWGAQTQRSLEHFSIGKDLIPREMITAYATLKKAAANANQASKRLDDKRHKLIVQVCDEILAGQHHDMFPLHVWMTGSGTQFNMNVNEVISNRCCQIAGTPLGSKAPVHPNDHVNMAQSSNDTFPSAMNIAAGVNVKQRLIPAVKALHDSVAEKVKQWKDVIKIGRTHMQDATPLTLGQEWSGYQGVLADDLDRMEDGLKGVYRLALGGTAVGTGINSAPGFGEAASAEIAKLTGLPFVSAPNKFEALASHDAIVFAHGALTSVATGLFKIFDAAGLTLPNNGLVFRTRTIIVALLVGVVVTLLASLRPAMRATRVPPIAAVREGATLPPAGSTDSVRSVRRCSPSSASLSW